MAIKVNGTEVVSDAKKGSFNTVNPGAFSTANRPSSPVEGDVIYDTDEDSLMFWDGTEWKNVGSGGLQPSPNIVSVVLTQDQENSNRFTNNNFTSTINNIGGEPDNLTMTAKVVGQLTIDASTSQISTNNYPGTQSTAVDLTLGSNYNLDNDVFEVGDIVLANTSYTPTTSAIATVSDANVTTAGTTATATGWGNNDFPLDGNVGTQASSQNNASGVITFSQDLQNVTKVEVNTRFLSTGTATLSEGGTTVASKSFTGSTNQDWFTIYEGSAISFDKYEQQMNYQGIPTSDDFYAMRINDQFVVCPGGTGTVMNAITSLNQNLVFQNDQDIELFQSGDLIQSNSDWNQTEVWSTKGHTYGGTYYAGSFTQLFDNTENGLSGRPNSFFISLVGLPATTTENGLIVRASSQSGNCSVSTSTGNYGITNSNIEHLIECPVGTQMTGIQWGGGGPGDGCGIGYIKVDGQRLVDTGLPGANITEVKVSSTDVSAKSMTIDGGSWLGADGSGEPGGATEVSLLSAKRGEGTIKAINGADVVIEPFVDNCFKEQQYLTHKTPKSITSDLKTDPIESYNPSTKTIKLDGLTNLTEYEANMAVKMVNPDGTDVLPFATSAITNVAGGTPSNYQAGAVLTNPANIYDGTAGNFAICTASQGQGPICTSNGSTLRYLGIRLQSFGTTQINTFTVEGIDYTFSTDTTAAKTYTIDLGSNVTLTQPIQFQSTVGTGYILAIYFDGAQLVNYTPQILTLTDGTNLDKFAVDDSVQGEYKGVYFGTGGQASPGFAATSTINFLSTVKQPITGSPGSSHCVVDLIDATTDILISSSVTGYTSAASIDGVNWTTLGNVNGGSAYVDYSIRDFLIQQLGAGTANGMRYFSWGGLTDWTACQIQLTESWIKAATSSSLVPNPALDARIKVIDVQNPNGSGVYQMTVSGGSWTNQANNSLDDYLWDNYIEGDPEPAYPLSNLFGGTIGTGYSSGTRAVFLGPNSTLTLNIESLNINATTVKLFIYSAGQPNILTVNGVQEIISTTTGDKEVDVTVNGQVKTISWSYDSTSAPYCYMKGIEFDGKLLVNRGILAENNVQIVKNGSGVVQFKDLANRTIALSSSNNQWLEDFCVASTTDRPVVSTTGFLRFDGLGNVECVESYPLAPVNMLNKNAPQLKFPLEFECVSSAPDAELGEGTYLETSVTATNTLGTSSKTSNVLVPSTTTRVAPAAESYEVNVTEYAETAAKIKTSSDRAAQQRVDNINETIEQAQQAAEDRANDYLN